MIKATSATGKVNYVTKVEVNGWQLTADEPVELGGKFLGPSPVQYLAASLASCTSITLSMYAGRKGLALNGIEVEVEFVNEPEGSYFIRKIHVGGTLTPEQEKRFIQIANACPVSKLLSNPSKINTIIV